MIIQYKPPHLSGLVEYKQLRSLGEKSKEFSKIEDSYINTTQETLDSIKKYSIESCLLFLCDDKNFIWSQWKVPKMRDKRYSYLKNNKQN